MAFFKALETKVALLKVQLFLVQSKVLTKVSACPTVRPRSHHIATGSPQSSVVDFTQRQLTGEPGEPRNHPPTVIQRACVLSGCGLTPSVICR